MGFYSRMPEGSGVFLDPEPAGLLPNKESGLKMKGATLRGRGSGSPGAFAPAKGACVKGYRVSEWNWTGGPRRSSTLAPHFPPEPSTKTPKAPVALAAKASGSLSLSPACQEPLPSRPIVLRRHDIHAPQPPQPVRRVALRGEGMRNAGPKVQGPNFSLVSQASMTTAGLGKPASKELNEPPNTRIITRSGSVYFWVLGTGAR